MTSKTITISKFDAGRRQLETAIDLWFHEKDPVSVHTLACAAYEIIHYISKVRNPSRRDLLLDTALIKDEYRVEYVKKLKAPGNFFKHAKEDGEVTIDFNPRAPEGFILFSILGVRCAGERTNSTENAYMWWLYATRPDLLTPEGKEMIGKLGPIDSLANIRRFGKSQFFDAYIAACHLNGR